MKCPRCNTDMPDQQGCSKCGLLKADQKAKIEVEYKDFKTSELLEIRQKKTVSSATRETNMAKKLSRRKTLEREFPAKSSLRNEKNSFPLLAVIVLVLLIITVSFILAHYLFLR